MEAGSDGRMVFGAVISNVIFFREAGRTSDMAFKLRALPRHEVWLESTHGPLENLDGTLRILNDADGGGTGVGYLSRNDHGYQLVLNAFDKGTEIKLQRLRASDGCTLVAGFDVEYQQGYESPGGYSDAYGIRYWDDVRYPVVALTSFDVVQPRSIDAD